MNIKNYLILKCASYSKHAEEGSHPFLQFSGTGCGLSEPLRGATAESSFPTHWLWESAKDLDKQEAELEPCLPINPTLSSVL